MKFAHTLADIRNAFVMRALTGEELPEFYYADTMPVRMGDAYISPIQDIFNACVEPTDSSKFLLMGHKGCGKSTELNNMSVNLQKDGYRVVTVNCADDLDLNNPPFTDLLILMGNALLKLAAELGCELPPKVKETFKTFWREGQTEITETAATDTSAEAGLSVSAPSVFINLLSFTVGARKAIKYGDETKTVYREFIRRRLSDWTNALNSTADVIAEKLDYKHPIIIFEDLDKLDIPDALELFWEHAKPLTDVNFPVIYTFPIALSYHSKYGNLVNNYMPFTFPMIKLKQLSGERCDEGYETMRRIVAKRADMALFDEDALTLMIEKTGGSLRDLFRVIISAATRARRRGSPCVETEDALRALESIKSELTRMIEQKHYPFLVNICNGNHKQIEDQETLLEMLEAHVVMEYDIEGWRDVHPLVADFLVDQGLLKKEEQADHE